MGNLLVFQSDFGIADGAVSAMYGVAYSVSRDLTICDLTHEIPQYNIWEASYRLIQTVQYWPKGSVFVSVVDPGVGSTRKSVAVRTKGGQYIITPDNGTLTHIKRMSKIIEAREIDEETNRLPYSGKSHTFHGRDIYAYIGARLATGIIEFQDIGQEIDTNDVVELNVPEASKINDIITGAIDIMDVRFGSLWTNISRELFDELGIVYGGRVEIAILNDTREVYRNIIRYGKSFADVHIGEPLVYINSLDYIAVAINQGSFSKAYNIHTGSNWIITIRRAPKIIYE
ncbi:MAG TPA: S-adenosyl-l-methionine hydroxide adenosyltransferase family protein [Clostridia bacterium]|nr:S-adenosyl-l-methionine hydroxide adenosyltransferase family protein [Clostridia bacterium]